MSPRLRKLSGDEVIDLSGLEEVACTSNTGPLPAILCMLVLFFALMFTFLVYMAFFDSQPAGTKLLIPLLVCFVCLALSVSTLWHPLFDYYWKTNPDGLLVKGIIRRQFIRWNEVHSIDTRWIWLWLAPCHVLRTNQGNVTIPTRNLSLGASVALHLDRQNKPEMFSPSQKSLRTWHPVLDALPEEIAWENQRHHELRNAHIVFAIILLASAILAIWLILTGRVAQSMLVGFLVFVLFKAQKLSPLVVWRATSGPNGLVVKAVVDVRLMAMVLPWHYVSQAEWLGNGLYLLGSQGSGVLIPWQPEDRASARLILSVLSHLHATPQFGLVPIPEVVLKAAE